ANAGSARPGRGRLRESQSHGRAFPWPLRLSASFKTTGFTAIRLFDDEGNAQVDAPFRDVAGFVGDHLGFAHPGALDVLHRFGDLAQSALYRILDALLRGTAELDDLGYGHVRYSFLR